MKISVVFGTRPEAIKLAPIILSLKACSQVSCHVCVTAQHRDMLDQVLAVFGIEPDTDLDLMRPGQSLAQLTARAIEAVDTYLLDAKPDLVLVQGDTTTVLAATLAAFYRGVPVGHVEAGLRTWNLKAPWPEEANRVLTTRLANLHFAPTPASRDVLLAEGIPAEKVFLTGNTVIDALQLALERIHTNPPVIAGLEALFTGPVHDARMVLITGHRRESFGDGLRSICEAIRDLADLFPDVHFVYPVHLNPEVQKTVNDLLGRASRPNIHLIEPQPYLPFVALMQRATVILTDSGGVQEEAPSLGKPVLVTRDTTERPEAVAAGCAKLVGPHREPIVAEVTRLLTDPAHYQSMSQAVNPYGDGKASQRIIEAILSSNPAR